MAILPYSCLQPAQCLAQWVCLVKNSQFMKSEC